MVRNIIKEMNNIYGFDYLYLIANIMSS